MGSFDSLRFPDEPTNDPISIDSDFNSRLETCDFLFTFDERNVEMELENDRTHDGVKYQWKTWRPLKFQVGSSPVADSPTRFFSALL